MEFAFGGRSAGRLGFYFLREGVLLLIGEYPKNI